MKKIILLFLLTLSYSLGFAQTVSFRVKLYRADEPVYLRLEQTSADIEGYDGDEITIEAVASVSQTPPLAAVGLKQLAIPGQAKEDLIMRPRMQEDGRAMQISIPAGNFSHLLIKVPQSIVLSVALSADINNSKVTVNGINSINLGGTLSSVSLNNVSDFGITVSSLHFGRRANGKFTLTNIRWTDGTVIVNGSPRPRQYRVDSFNSNIELSVPENIKANIIACSEFGQTFSNLSFRDQPASATDLKVFNHDYARAKGQKQPDVRTIVLNNGAINIRVASTYGTIFLKKQ